MIMTISVLSAPEKSDKCTIDENINITISSKDDCESNIDGPTLIATSESSNLMMKLKKQLN